MLNYNRLEYIEKHLEFEDAKEYKRLIEGEEPSDFTRERIIRDNPEMNPDTNYPADLIRELAVKDIEELSEKVQRQPQMNWIPSVYIQMKFEEIMKIRFLSSFSSWQDNGYVAPVRHLRIYSMSSKSKSALKN